MEPGKCQPILPLTHKGYVALGEKDAGISVWYISFLSIMASWSEWWWHLVSTLFPLKAFVYAQKTNVCVYLYSGMCMCINPYLIYIKVSVVDASYFWDRQVLAPDYWHLCSWHIHPFYRNTCMFKNNHSVVKYKRCFWPDMPCIVNIKNNV